MSDELAVVDALRGIDADREVAHLANPGEPSVGPVPDEAAQASLLERRDDLIGVEQLTAAYDAVRGSTDRSSAEIARRRLRALAPWFLRHAAREPEEELARRSAFPTTPKIGFEASVALGESRQERDETYRRWLALERSLESLHAARSSAREEAARRTGAGGVADLLGATHASSPDAVAAAFERAVIVPLDEAVGRAAGAAWYSYVRSDGTRSAADAPRVHWLVDHGSWIDRGRILGVLRWLGTEMESGGDLPITIVASDGVGVGAAWRITSAGRGWVGVGSCAGPATLRSALGALGAATRAAFVSSTRCGAAARFGDPVFACAADVLFGRLILCPRFLEAAGLPENPAATGVVGVHEAVATRVGWVYLQTVLSDVDADSDAFERGIERATGGPVTPAHRERVRDRDPSAASTLQGTVLGLLLEERLRSRFGRAWFRSPRARGWLRSMWEAEPDHAPEGMARAAELGELEPTPVLDASRAALHG